MVRPDALLAVADLDPAVAQPILREPLEGQDETWVALLALDRVDKHALVELRDAVRTAERDPRRSVARLAASVAKRLDKLAGI